MSAARSERGITIADAINNALDSILAADERALIMGEDVGAVGGVFRVTRGLQRAHGSDRVMDTPLGEAGIVGTAIGLAMNGFRPIVEIQFDGFIFPALNQVIGHMAKFQQRLDFREGMPVVLRLPNGGRIGAAEFHSESPEALFAHSPHLRVVSASTPDTAGALLRAAYASDDPCIYLEPKRLYRRNRIPDADQVESVALDSARVLRTGIDATIVTYGPCVPDGLEAAARLSAEGIEVSVVDLVSVAPIDESTVAEQVAATGRLIAVTEAVGRCSIGSEIVSLAARAVFDSLKTAPVLVSAPNSPPPPPTREDSYFPDVDRVVDAVREAMK